jgi:hypothetical protein
VHHGLLLCSGEIRIDVNKGIKWVLPSELKDYEFCPADAEIVERLIK